MQQLTLKHFILQQEVLNLYRRAIRATRGPQPLLPHIHPSVLTSNQEYQTLSAARRQFDGYVANSTETGTLKTW